MSRDAVTSGPPAAFAPLSWRSAAFAGRRELVHVLTSADIDMSLADAARSMEARRRVCGMMDVPFNRLTVAEQVHGAGVAVVGPDEMGCGRDAEHPPISGADALVTAESEVPLLVLSADCAPIAVFDPVHRVLAVAHAGWRGVVEGVIAAVMATMVKTFDCRPSDCVAMIGPCARACCYEIGTDVSDRLPPPVCGGPRAADGDECPAAVRVRNGRRFLDLAVASATMLSEAGLRRDAIDATDICTICDTRYHSYRRQLKAAGRNALMVALRSARFPVCGGTVAPSNRAPIRNRS